MVYTHVYTIFRHTCFATQLLIHEPKLKIHILLVGLHRFENGTRASNPVKHILTAQIHVYIQFMTRPQPWGYCMIWCHSIRPRSGIFYKPYRFWIPPVRSTKHVEIANFHNVWSVQTVLESYFSERTNRLRSH